MATFKLVRAAPVYTSTTSAPRVNCDIVMDLSMWTASQTSVADLVGGTVTNVGTALPLATIAVQIPITSWVALLALSVAGTTLTNAIGAAQTAAINTLAGV